MLVTYLITKVLTNTKIALFTAFVIALNPWSIHFARASYESIFSAFFYLLAVYIVLRLRGWKILWSLPFFISGFLSYFSAKTLLLPLTISSIFLINLIKKESIKPIIFLNIIVIAFLAIYLPLLGKHASGSRFGELQNHDVSNIVNQKRNQSIDSPLKFIFENKLQENLKIRLKASLGVFSPSFLFIDGQPESIPSSLFPIMHLYIY